MGKLMHNGAGASNPPKKENTEILNTAESTTTPDPVSASSSSKKSTDERWWNLVISFFIPIFLYIGLFCALYFSHVGFVLSDIIGCGLVLMILGYIQSIFKTKSELATPIQIILAIILILSLSIYCLPKFNKDNITQTTSTNYSSSGSETLFFVGTEQLVSNKSFPQGKEVRLTVSGAPINFVTISGIKVLTQEYGTYIFRFNSVGSLIFTGSGSQSSVTIKW